MNIEEKYTRCMHRQSQVPIEYEKKQMGQMTNKHKVERMGQMTNKHKVEKTDRETMRKYKNTQIKREYKAQK